MQNTTHAYPKANGAVSLVLMVLVLGMVSKSAAQSFVNGDFENGSTGWDGCIVEIGTAVTYGGVGTNYVAEVDGNFDEGPEDDRVLCQTISGFTIGALYRLDFEATRRGNHSAPDTVSVTVSLDNDALFRTVTRTGGYAMVSESFEFTASSTTHEFRVDPNFQGSFGMIFDNFSITPASALPVELLYFTGEAATQGVRLDWATATERDNDHFTVQRSPNASEWADLFDVQGAGNSYTQLGYSVVDDKPLNGLSYYRLKQVDTDGAETIYNTVPVQMDAYSNADLVVFPNPSNGGPLWLSVGHSAESVTVPVSICDMQGRLVHHNTITLAPGAPADLASYVDLSEGVYLVSVTMGHSMRGVRLVVQ